MNSPQLPLMDEKLRLLMNIGLDASIALSDCLGILSNLTHLNRSYQHISSDTVYLQTTQLLANATTLDQTQKKLLEEIHRLHILLKPTQLNLSLSLDEDSVTNLTKKP